MLSSSVAIELSLALLSLLNSPAQPPVESIKAALFSTQHLNMVSTTEGKPRRKEDPNWYVKGGPKKT